MDLEIAEVLSVLAAIVNRASRPKKTSAEAVPVCEVPTGLLRQAQHVLNGWRDGEFSTDAIRQASKRLFD